MEVRDKAMKIPVNIDPEEVPTAKDEQFKERLHHLKIVAEKQPAKEAEEKKPCDGTA